MYIEELKKKIEAERAEFCTLTLTEKLERNKKHRIASLLNVGYISPDEAKKYNEALTELPTERKDLVVAYYLMGLDSYINEAPTVELTDNIQRAISNLPNTAKESLRRGGTLADGMTDKEVEEALSTFYSLPTNNNIKKAEIFVGAKRARIRAKLLKFVLFDIANNLFFEDKDSEIDSFPYLKEFLKKRGYKGKGKSLSDADKKAMQEAAEYYLDLMELSFLNGTTLIRQEEYKKYQNDKGEWLETFYYRDEVDEVLTSYEATPIILDNAIGFHYGDTTAKGAIDMLSEIAKQFLIVDSKAIEQIKKSKFKYILEEGGLC